MSIQSIQITLARWYLILRYGKSRTPRYLLITIGAALIAQVIRKLYKLSRRKCELLKLGLFIITLQDNFFTVIKLFRYQISCG
jgi:hypothetical protein